MQDHGRRASGCHLVPMPEVMVMVCDHEKLAGVLEKFDNVVSKIFDDLWQDAAHASCCSCRVAQEARFPRRSLIPP